MSRIGKSIQKASISVITKAGGKGMGVTANGYQISFEGDEIF